MISLTLSCSWLICSSSSNVVWKEEKTYLKRPSRSLYVKVDNKNTWWWWRWWWLAFVVWLTGKRLYPYFQPRPLPETRIITNLWHLINLWTDWPHLVVSINNFWAGSEQLHCWVHIVLRGINTPKKQHFTFSTMSPRKIKMFHYHRQKTQKSFTHSFERTPQCFHWYVGG